MESRRLGRSGLRVSEVVLGSWLTFGSSVDEHATRACVRAALDAGIHTFDTADVYALGKAEEVLGRALEGIPRKDLVLATKVFWPTGKGPNDKGLSRKHVVETLHASLARLKTDYVDVYQCHRFDPDVPLEETVRAMEDLVRAGKTLYWGVSVWTGAQIAEAIRIARALGGEGPIVNQPEFSLLDRRIEAEVLPVSRREGVGQWVFSPLAQGVLTGKYSGGARPAGTRGADDAAQSIHDRPPRPRRARPRRSLRGARQGGGPLPRPARARLVPLGPGRRRGRRRGDPPRAGGRECQRPPA